MDPNTGAVESVEETEVSLKRKEDLEKCIGLGLRCVKGLPAATVHCSARLSVRLLKSQSLKVKAFVLSLLVTPSPSRGGSFAGIS